MLERLWNGRSCLHVFLLPLSAIYGLVTSFIRLTYLLGWRRAWRAPVPVAVVGNITVGGTGKTPLVIWLVLQLQQRGLHVGVVSRGYGGKASSYPHILTPTTTAQEAGDEPTLIAKTTGAPVAVSPSRPDAVKALLSSHPLDIIISDDGLQHHALGRDLEIVVVDTERRFGNGYLLPAGPLRESKKRLQKVDAVVFNGAGVSTDKYNKNTFNMHLKPKKAVNLKTGEQVEPKTLSSVIVMAGIGHPPRFFCTVRNCGIFPLKEIAFADHQHYTLSSLSVLAQPDQSLLMTEKDAVKCLPFAQENWWFLPVDAVLGQDAEKLITEIMQLCR